MHVLRTFRQVENGGKCEMMKGMTIELPGAVVDVEKQEWDSAVLKRACARIVAIRPAQGRPRLSLNGLGDELKKKNLEYVTVRWPEADRAVIDELDSLAWLKVDTIVNFEADLSAVSALAPAPEIRVRQATSADESTIVSLAVASFKRSRFHADPVLNTEIAARVHEEWARNSVRGKVANAVLVVEKGGETVGFVTCKLGPDIGTIELIAVSKRQSGQGLGQALVGAARDWIKAQGKSKIGVRTQIDNQPAVQLYRKMGFREQNHTVTYRWSSR